MGKSIDLYSWNTTLHDKIPLTYNFHHATQTFIWNLHQNRAHKEHKTNRLSVNALLNTAVILGLLLSLF